MTMMMDDDDAVDEDEGDGDDDDDNDGDGNDDEDDDYDGDDDDDDDDDKDDDDDMRSLWVSGVACLRAICIRIPCCRQIVRARPTPHSRGFVGCIMVGNFSHHDTLGILAEDGCPERGAPSTA